MLPPHERLVAVESDKAAHAEAASRLPFPQKGTAESAETDVCAAVAYAVDHRDTLISFRKEQLAKVDAVVASLAPMSAWIEKMAAGTKHEHLVMGTNIASLAAWCDARRWPDTAFVERWVRGFPIVGDIPDSGLFRPQDQPPTSPASTFSPANNMAWCNEVIRKVSSAATSPLTGSRRVLEAVYAQTRKEAALGYVKGPYTRSELNNMFGTNKYREPSHGQVRHRAGPRR